MRRRADWDRAKLSELESYLGEVERALAAGEGDPVVLRGMQTSLHIALRRHRMNLQLIDERLAGSDSGAGCCRGCSGPNGVSAGGGRVRRLRRCPQQTSAIPEAGLSVPPTRYLRLPGSARVSASSPPDVLCANLHHGASALPRRAVRADECIGDQGAARPTGALTIAFVAKHSPRDVDARHPLVAKTLAS